MALNCRVRGAVPVQDLGVTGRDGRVTRVERACIHAIGAKIGSGRCIIVGLVEALCREFALFLVNGHRCAFSW